MLGSLGDTPPASQTGKTQGQVQWCSREHLAMHAAVSKTCVQLLSSSSSTRLPAVRTQLGCLHSCIAAHSSNSMAEEGPGQYTYRWPRPAVTVDTVIVAQPQEGVAAKVLLIQRKHPPFQGHWAIPGGFVDQNEPLEAAAARELQEETSVDPSSVDLFQVGAFGDPGRDPRGWTVTVAYAAVVPSTDLGVKAADDAVNAQWFDVEALPDALAFDHKDILAAAFQRLANMRR